MPRVEHVSIDLAGLNLPEARTGQTLALGELTGVHVLSVIRHRH
jgi:hypothetical protein